MTAGLATHTIAGVRNEAAPSAVFPARQGMDFTRALALPSDLLLDSHSRYAHSTFHRKPAGPLLQGMLTSAGLTFFGLQCGGIW